jgi:hypothetical protein
MKNLKVRLLAALIALLVCAAFGSLVAHLVGIPLWIGALGMVAVGVGMSFVRLPGGLRAGVYVEVWTRQVVEHYTHAMEGTFLDGVPDFSQYADNNVIHLSDVSGDPTVLVDNTTYPLDIEELEDGDISIKLSKFETKATGVTDDELYSLAYDKMALVKTRHGNRLSESILDKSIHAFAPSEDTTETPVLLTTGEADETGRKKLQRVDIISLRRKLDKLKVPKSGRRLVLCSDHISDLLECDQKFQGQYHDYSTGVIAKMYGFEIYEAANCPLFDSSTKQKKSFGAVATAKDFEASVFFYVPRMFKCKGSTKMYYSKAENDPVNKRNLVSFTTRFVALPQKKEKAVGAIISAKTA